MSPFRTRGRITAAGALLAFLAVFQGCAATTSIRNAGFDGLLVTGQYRAAAEQSEGRLGYSASSGADLPPVVLHERNVLDHLEAAEAWRLAGDPQRSIAHFDAAEQALRQVELEADGAMAARQAGAALFGDRTLPYRPSPAEAVLINYYKALTFLREGDRDNARVELNRSYERTQRAVSRYEREIAEARSEASSRGISSIESNSVVAQHFPEMLRWEVYDSFILPPAVYLHGIVLGLGSAPSDQDQARSLLQRVAAVTNNPVVLEDYHRLDSGGLCPAIDCVWIIAEHGLGPHLVERRFDLPVPTSNGIVVLSLAIPALETRILQQAPAFTIQGSNGAVPLHSLGTMDQVVQTEFQKRFPGILMRASAGAIVKAFAQEEAYKQGGAVAGFIANVATVITTNADVRMWRSTPGVFSVGRIEKGGANGLMLNAPTGEQWIELNGEGPMIVYIKHIDQSTPPVVHTISGLSGAWL